MSTNYNINITAKDQTKGTFGKINTGLGGVAASATKVKTAIGVAGAALAAFGVASKIQQQVDQFDALAKSARTAGSASSNEAFKGFQVLKQAMGEAGIEASTFERALLQTTSRLQEGLEGGEAFSDIVAKMGGSITDANGSLKDGATVMQEMVNALNNGTISTDEFAKVVGGRAGPLIQAQFASLNTSAGALEQTLASVEANSNIVSLDAAQNAEKFNDTVGRLKNAFGQLMTDALEPLMPILVDLAERILANMPAIIEKVKAGFDALSPVLSLIGTILTEVVAPILSKVFEGLGLILDATKPLFEAALPALESAFDSVARVVNTVVGYFSSAYDKLVQFGEYASNLKKKVTGAFDGMASSVKNSVGGMVDSTTGFMADMYDEWVGHSIIPDLADRVIEEFERMEGDAVASTHGLVKSSTKAVEQGFGKFEDALVDSLRDGKIELKDFESFFESSMEDLIRASLNGGDGIEGVMSGMFGNLGGMFQGGMNDIFNTTNAGMNNMGSLVGSGINNMLGGFSNMFSGLGSMFQGGFSGLLNSAMSFGSSLLGGMGGIFGKLGGALGGLFGGGGGGSSMLGSIVSGIGSLFGGFFADGGFLPAGQFGIVGEAGPELITGPANITPMNQVGNSGGATSVNITIQAIDTQTGTQFLLDNKRQIESIIQSAYNKRGKQGIV